MPQITHPGVVMKCGKSFLFYLFPKIRRLLPTMNTLTGKALIFRIYTHACSKVWASKCRMLLFIINTVKKEKQIDSSIRDNNLEINRVLSGCNLNRALGKSKTYYAPVSIIKRCPWRSDTTIQINIINNKHMIQRQDNDENEKPCHTFVYMYASNHDNVRHFWYDFFFLGHFQMWTFIIRVLFLIRVPPPLFFSSYIRGLLDTH